MRSVRYAALATLAAVYGLVLAQERASQPATPVDATSQEDARGATGEADPAEDIAADADADDAVAEDSAATAADADNAAVPGSQPGKEAAAASATAPAGTNRKPPSATGSPQRFEPTEKVRPDFDVAFPVDI